MHRQVLSWTLSVIEHMLSSFAPLLLFCPTLYAKTHLYTGCTHNWMLKETGHSGTTSIIFDKPGQDRIIGQDKSHQDSTAHPPRH